MSDCGPNYVLSYSLLPGISSGLIELIKLLPQIRIYTKWVQRAEEPDENIGFLSQHQDVATAILWNRNWVSGAAGGFHGVRDVDLG